MAATARKFGFCCLFLTLLSSTAGQNDSVTTQAPSTTTTPSPTEPPSSELPDGTDLGECTCDLTKLGCDVNCCCDEECSADDRAVFTYCEDVYLEPDSRMCVQEKIMFDAENGERYPYTTEVTESGLFCVYTNNNEDSNYYNIPDKVTTDAQFEEYTNTYGGFSYQQKTVDSAIKTTYYMSGDPIYTVYESGTLGLLGLASPLTSGLCKDTNPAAFLYDQHHECTRYIANLETDCDDIVLNAPFNALTYYDTFRVISTPEVFQDFTNETETDPTNTTLYNHTAVLDVLPHFTHTCIGVEGLNVTCDFNEPPPPTLEDGICKNVAVQVEYLVEHNSTAGLTNVNVTFVLRDVRVNDSSLSLGDDAGFSLTQAFVSNFSKLGDTGTEQKSGSPGYIVGQPLLAGKMASTVLDENNNEAEVYAIEISDDRYNWLTMVKSSATGQCTNATSQRVPVMFEEDMRSGCVIRLSLDDLSNGRETCEMFHEAALEALRGYDPPTHVARFGDTEPENTGDWIQILDDVDNLNAPSYTGGGTCTGVVIGMHIEVLYAHVGHLGNPQPKVIGVKFHYHTGEISYQCIGPYCMEGMSDQQQSFEVVSSVGFVDASDPVVGVDAEKPSVSASLPEDFFAPFT